MIGATDESSADRVVPHDIDPVAIDIVRRAVALVLRDDRGQEVCVRILGVNIYEGKCGTHPVVDDDGPVSVKGEPARVDLRTLCRRDKGQEPRPTSA